MPNIKETDTETILTPKIPFTNGTTLSYNLNYYSGSGNHLAQILINDSYPPAVIPSTTPLPGSGTIGYWNGIPDVGMQNGIYHIKQEFFTDHLNQTITRPNGTIIKHTYPSINEPYKFGINIHTGHNGLLNFSLDNFQLCHEIQDNPEPPEPTCEDILLIKPGKSKGLWKNGCSPGILKVFSKKIGWAKTL